MSFPSSKRAQASNERRLKIMITAEQLFGEHGCDAVSLNEINKAAGQRNTSALHYYFGSKDGLLEAIILTHYAEVEAQINEVLDTLESREKLSCRDIVAAMTQPFINKLDDERGVNYLRIMAQQLSVSSQWLDKGRLGREDVARERIFQLFKRERLTLPAAVAPVRMILYTTLLFHSLAAYSRFERNDISNPLGNKEMFSANLIDSLVGVFTPPLD